MAILLTILVILLGLHLLVQGIPVCTTIDVIKKNNPAINLGWYPSGFP